MILRASVLLPMSGPPIRDAALVVSGQRLREVGRWRDVAARYPGKSLDLGEVVALPGFVNAHCHLDYTAMAGQFPPPKLFIDWLKQITDSKAGWGLADYQESWRAGADMLLRTGTTTVADIEAVPELLPELWESTPLRVFSFLEMIGITSRRQPGPVLQEALEKLGTLSHGRCRAALSPHAPYSTVPELLRICAVAARRRRRLLCTHVAESRLEYEMFTHGRGEMFTWLQRSGRNMSDCGKGSPVHHLERAGVLGPNLLATHANYLGREDAALLARHGVSVVHCPRSYFYFRHELFPWKRLARAGVNICLGTDSLASVCKRRGEHLELSMFEEMRELARREPWLSPRTILRAATLNGARALGLAGELGELRAGAYADLVTVPLRGPPANPYEAVVHHRGQVEAAMLGGRWVFGPFAKPGLAAVGSSR